MSENKKQLRQRILQKRNTISSEMRKEKSQAITQRLLSLPQFHSAQWIMSYVTFRSEVDTIPFMEASLVWGKRIAVPVVEKATRRLLISEVLDISRELFPGAYGIMEPVENFRRIISPQLLNLIIVPGVAFDLQGNRLGYGGGYYDRFLKTLSPGVPLIAVAFDLQVVEKIPAEYYDLKVHIIVTESRLIYCPQRE